MKLAEALVLRADLQKRIAQIRTRLTQSALVQEGERPPENPTELLAELEEMLAQLQDLIIRINKTNLQATLPDGILLKSSWERRLDAASERATAQGVHVEPSGGTESTSQARSLTQLNGITLTDALARRDILTQHHSIISGLADAASNRIERYGRSEIRKLATVDVAALRRQMDELARQRRELDVAIQATNWTTDVLE